ncbi:MAG: hypothetical protein FD171_1962, partial [Actinobacteria bacterium]
IEAAHGLVASGAIVRAVEAAVGELE